MNEIMVDYVLATAKQIEWQKWLNQWKHIYEIEVISMCVTGNDNGAVTILIKRTRIPGK
jgi:hypothetical protein